MRKTKYLMSMEDDSGGVQREPLQLEPFVHQVGGHSSMLQLNRKTICKPLIPKELKFYQNCPECLKCFAPEFKGVIEVSFSTDVDGYLGLTTFLPVGYQQPGANDELLSIFQEKAEKIKHRIRVCQSGSIQIESDSVDGQKQMFEKRNRVKEQQTSSCLLNPWVLHCHQEQMNKLRNHGSAFTEKYILLENLTSKYEFPCIMDIKMGTQPYGDDQSMEKRQGHLTKMALTTSTSLGIRICGMQVYHHDSGHYVCHNKYYGRGLTVDGFRQALYQFFHDGHELHHDIISQVLLKLEKLYEVVASLNAFRFFTSSLLLIYNGKKSEMNYQERSNCSSTHYKGNHKFQDNGNANRVNHSRKNRQFANDSSDWEHLDKNSAVNALFSECSCDHLEQESDMADVRMIDFAHSTISDADSQKIHVGPDEGYLFGLKNLVAQLKTFRSENQSSK